MNKRHFIMDLKSLLEDYKMDKRLGFDSLKLATGIYWLLYSLYDFPKREVK